MLVVFLDLLCDFNEANLSSYYSFFWDKRELLRHSIYITIAMERLHLLLHSLNTQQVKVLKNYLTSFSTRDPKTKFWELASFLLKRKSNIPTISECSMKIYKSMPDGRILQLKNRLYSKVLDSLLIDINTVRANYDDQLHPIEIKLRKKMILYDLIKYTGLRQTVGFDLIDDIISGAKQNEFYFILMDALYIKKWNYGLRKGVDFFHKMNQEIAHFERCKQAVQKASDLSTELGSFSTFNPKADKVKLSKFISESMEVLKELYFETKARTVWYSLKTFEIAHLQNQKKIPEARDVAISVLDRMKGDRIIGRAVRFGVWHDHLGQFETELGNYDSALENLRKARTFFHNSPMNISINRKLELQVYFLKGDYSSALEIANDLSQTDAKITGDFRRDVILYYKACCHFMLGEFRECARLLGLKFQLTRDKLGWEVNIRFMRIMTMVERGNPDEAFSMVQSLAKHMERYKNAEDFSERDQMLLLVFRELAKEGFAFDRPGDKIYRLLLLLMEKGKPHSWEPLTPELIKIHDWVIRKYSHFLPPKPGSAARKPRKKAKGNA
jgi:tetratricopeptide (TPR) repeat protein